MTRRPGFQAGRICCDEYSLPYAVGDKKEQDFRGVKPQGPNFFEILSATGRISADFFDGM